MYSSALERKETRGMHKHLDYPEQDASQHHYLISGGLDEVWVKTATLNSVEPSKAKIGVLA
jgi:succinate dehydrogenase/fumarate reductase flavoprotein subunit